MTDRFEFEVDTTKANEFWHAEVEENLRRKAEEDAAKADGLDKDEPHKNKAAAAAEKASSAMTGT